jgi:hypothetical protein
MRAAVLIVGVLVFLVGLSEVVAGQWWIGPAKSMAASPAVRWFGIVGVAIGVVMLLAAHRRLVGLRSFITLLGLMMVVFSAHYLVDPDFWNRVMADAFLDRSVAVQTRFLVIQGLIRMVVGAAVVCAAHETRSVGN